MLIGPKGSGKTYIGTVLERRAGIHFLRVEPVWLALADGQDGWLQVEREIDACLRKTDVVTMESLGGSEGFERLRHNLSKKYTLRYVRICVPLDVCLDRVRNRNSSDHIEVSDAKVAMYNRVAAEVDLPWDLELNNDPPMAEELILNATKGIQQVDAAVGPTAATDL